MGERTEIAWTHHTFNPWIGCARVSEGCRNCYAAVDTFARQERSRGRELWGVEAERHVTGKGYWHQPLVWDRKAREAGERRRVFVGSLCDVFEDREELRAGRGRLAHLIEATSNLDWLFLTKRPRNAHRLWCEAMSADATQPDVWAPHIWLGTTVENQDAADARLPHLLAVPVRVRFVSCEPLLEAVDLRAALGSVEPRAHWVIVGGESGAHARPFELGWARSLRDCCKAAGVPFFMKQMGSRPLYRDTQDMSPDALRGWEADHAGEEIGTHGACVVPLHRAGGDPREWPEDLSVREVPHVQL